jgi:opacity protein-like surface antigen
MKKILVAITLLMASHIANADMKPYIEGSVGYFKPSTTNEGNFNWFEGNPITSYSIKTSAQGVPNFSVELGARNIFGTGYRLGISETYLKLINLKTNGFITTSAGTHPEINVDGGNANVNLIMLNGYYDFSIPDSKLTPYIGAGIGSYANNRMTGSSTAWSLMTGVNYALTNNLYLGIKGTYYGLSGTTVNDGTNNTFNSTNAYSVNAIIGYKF